MIELCYSSLAFQGGNEETGVKGMNQRKRSNLQWPPQVQLKCFTLSGKYGSPLKIYKNFIMEKNTSE